MPLPSIDPRAELVAVIMAGGAGTRFWPSSTNARPKQLLRFFGDRSLLQQSYDRVVDLVGPARVLVVTNAGFVDAIREQLPDLPPDNVVGEPERKDTAAATALAALLVEKRFGNAIMAVLTADQLIDPREAFHKTLLSAARGASSGEALYTFGVQPSHPATGYGYLEVGDALPLGDDVDHYALLRFVEKPDLPRAQGYVASGRFLWNSGMFVWRAQAVLDEIERSLPQHLKALRPAVSEDGKPTFPEALAVAFGGLARVSVDVAVMEKARTIRCVRAAFAWSDVGSFPALAEHLPHDAAHNAHRGRIIGLESRDNLVFSEDESELVALIGVEGLIVVRAGQRTLVVPRARAEEIKKLVARLADGDV